MLRIQKNIIGIQRSARAVLLRNHKHYTTVLSSKNDSTHIASPSGPNYQTQNHKPHLSSSSSNNKPFEKILIANRGEIACRIIRTAKRLGIRTVALYSEADGPGSLHASMADEAYLIGDGPSPVDSYLRGDKVLDIALKTGAQAIHPGYGFLSENSAFATTISSHEDLTFVGPPPSAILAMGSKSHSKSIMENAGVPTTPGHHSDANQEPDYLLHQAITKVGFPLLIKATMGGGGKGMRLVHTESDFLPSLESCRRESLAAFGDTNVILEKYLVHPRHIEIQIMADAHGNIVHLYERDCSLQRRHQKIIEEAPASDLSTEVRERMGRMAVKAAEAVEYVNAGTVEFLVDTQSKEEGEGTNFYFCEMNTRLQVEHPVTEMITRQDLVEWQLRIAAGEELPIKDQKDVPCIGHAMEARIYAENPGNDFLPATGKVWHHDPPVPSNVGQVDDVRVDTGIRKGDDITVYYDPMVSKLIVYGETRRRSLDNLISSLKKYQISGVPSNVPFLVKCAEHPIFSNAGEINTGFLEDYADDVKLDVDDGVSVGSLERAICSCALSLAIENRVTGSSRTLKERTKNGSSSSPWSNTAGSWRMGGLEGRHERTFVPIKTNGDEAKDDSIYCLSNRDGSFDVITKVGDGFETVHVDGSIDDTTDRMEVTINGTKTTTLTVVFREDVPSGTITINAWSDRKTSPLELPFSFGMTFRHPLPIASDALLSGSSSANGVGTMSVKSPMPGKITRIEIAEGDAIEENGLLLVMEAMKMEHSIYAPLTGVVTELNCSVGDVVKDGYLLAVVKDDDADGTEDETMRTTSN